MVGLTDKLRRAFRFSTVPEHLIHDPNVSDRSFRLWCILDRYAGRDEVAFPSRRTLANDLNCSLASVDRAVTELCAGGWLEKERREAGGTNLYTLLIAKAPKAAKTRPQAVKSQVSAGGVVTGEDTPPVVTHDDTPLITHDDTPSSPVTTPLITGDAQKEESLRRNQGSETCDTSLRSVSRAESNADGASGTRTIGAHDPTATGAQKPVPGADEDDGPGEREDVERLCAHLADRIAANDPDGKRPTVTKRWRDAARLMLDRDRRTEEQVHRCIEWCQSDEFWRANVLSMPTLREKYAQLRLQAQRGTRGHAPNVHHVPVDHPDHERLASVFR